MVNQLQPGTASHSHSFVVLHQRFVKRCHISVPGTATPVSAIFYDDCFYSYVKFFPDLDTAQRGAMRLLEKGNPIILTRVPKGLVLWVREPDAYLA